MWAYYINPWITLCFFYDFEFIVELHNYVRLVLM